MGFFSWVSDTWESVKSAASSAWEGVKSVASKVVDTCVEWGGKVVDTVKNVYKAVKPYIKHAKEIVKVVGNTLGAKFPWVKAAADIIAKGLEFLEKIEDSPLVKRISKDIEWALKTLEKIKETFFNKSEEKEAMRRQKDLQRAYDAMETEEQRRSIRFAMLINDYVLLRSRIEDALNKFESSNSTNFEHYLRLRATQKLLKITERRLNRAKDLTEIESDDLFLIQTGAELLVEHPNLSTEELQCLDRIIQRRFDGKTLLPFVFEELLFSWGIKLEEMEEKRKILNSEIVKLKREFKQLEIKQKVEELSTIELAKSVVLREEIKEVKYELKEQEGKNRAMQNYIYAAEGFLQVLEKTEEQWIEDGREYIIEDSKEIGMLLIQCVERGLHWDELELEQQSLIRDFANIFAKDSKKRTEKMKSDLFSLEEIEVA